MNAEHLLEHYERVADAPDAVAKLRRLVLELAVRGKLVEQDASNGTAADALSRISASGAFKGKGDASTPRFEGPFSIPPNWAWVRFSAIADFSAGRTPPRHDSSFWNTGDHPWVSIADMADGEPLAATKETVSEAARKQVFKAEPAQPGTMIMSFKLTIGKIARLAMAAYHNEAIISIKPKLADFDPYLFKVLPMFARQGNTKGAIKGVTLNRDSISNILIPLPPIGEQRRIVAKLDELMALCDQLEATRTEREAKRDQLATASLARLNEPTPETFTADVGFALDALPSLTARVDQIKQLRQTIFDLAVRGRLVVQDPKDQSAQDWVRSIKGDICKVNLLLPPTWCWTQLGTMVATMDAGWSPQCEDHPRRDSAKWGVLKTTAVQALAFDWRHHKELPAKLEPRPQHEAREADILVTRAGPKNRVGVCCVVEKVEPRLMISDKLIRFRLVDGPCARYIALALNAGHSYECVEAAKSGMAVMQMNISQDKLRAVPIPLPPLAEQKRIVARVDELMVLCDQLETSLTTADDTRRRLLDALLHVALAPITKPSREHARAAVSGYLVSRLASKRNFGRTAHMKHLYFAESLLGLDLGGRYMREAAGPLDTGIYELEKRAEAAGWYTHSVETLPSGNEKVSYQPGKALKAIAEEGINVLGRSRAEMDRLIDLLGGLKTESVEIIATLFAAWNDALFDGQTPEDNWIIKEVREHWHVSKQRFTPADLSKWLGWMRQNDVVPHGHPPRTMQQTTMEF